MKNTDLSYEIKFKYIWYAINELLHSSLHLLLNLHSILSFLATAFSLASCIGWMVFSIAFSLASITIYDLTNAFDLISWVFSIAIDLAFLVPSIVFLTKGWFLIFSWIFCSALINLINVSTPHVWAYYLIYLRIPNYLNVQTL